MAKLDRNKSSFVKVEKKQKKRFYETVRTIEYLDHEKEL
jgi:hypothetical protein